MTTFRKESKAFYKDLSRAAAWMMRENAGKQHWWRPGVLTNRNNDQDARPIFDDARANEIFEELIARELLVLRGDAIDDSGQPAYAMKYDIEEWDRTVSDGVQFTRFG